MHMHNPKNNRIQPSEIGQNEHGTPPTQITIRIYKKRGMPHAHSRSIRGSQSSKVRKRTLSTGRLPIYRLPTSLRLSKPRNTTEQNIPFLR